MRKREVKGRTLPPRFAEPRLAILTCLMPTLLPWHFLIIYLLDRAMPKGLGKHGYDFQNNFMAQSYFQKCLKGDWNSKSFQEMFKEAYIQHSNLTGAENLRVLCGDSTTLVQLMGISPPSSHPLSKYSCLQKHCCAQGNYLRSSETWDSWSILCILTFSWKHSW